MNKHFDSFVVFAEMRTGSNFLETNLNAFDGISCHGEAFNPHFIGYPDKDDIFGVTLAMRDADPSRLINTIRDETNGIGGFRFFHDHDPRALDICLKNPNCAKIILTRNPIDSYVSWKIARTTGQWKLTNVKRRKDSKAIFDADEFKTHMEALQEFQIMLLNTLQVSGQTAFYVAYEDLQDINVMNGLAKFLGATSQLESLDKSLKRQNPSPISEKVVNFEAMQTAVAQLDTFNLNRTPNFEPRRGPYVPGYFAAANAALLYMPVRSGPEQQVKNWLAEIDDVSVESLLTKFNQKSLRQWKRKHVGHRSFTVVRHPVARAHKSYCQHILMPGPDCFSEIRRTLRRSYKLPIPQGEPGPDYDRNAHRMGFLAFLTFLKGNLLGQTGIRVDAAWATQSSQIQGFGKFALPDMIIRETEMDDYLGALAEQVGIRDAPSSKAVPEGQPFTLQDIYDDEIERLVADVYQRDYLMFGFDRWAYDNQAAFTD